MQQVLRFQTGVNTCAYSPGKFCPFVRTKVYGTKFYCALFDEERLFAEGGWLMRCPECLAWERATKPPAVMHEDDLPEDMTEEEYDQWYADSQVIDGIRMGPLVKEKFTEEERVAQLCREAPEEELARLQAVVAEINAWAVCAAIASPADMAQNLPRIIEITGSDEPELTKFEKDYVCRPRESMMCVRCGSQLHPNGHCPGCIKVSKHRATD